MLVKHSRILYTISFLEGSALMATEIIGAKVMAPFYGSSLIVWTSIFTCTLSGLALGYFFGAKLSTQENLHKRLLIILLFSTIYLAIMPLVSNFMMEATLSLSLEIGSLLSVLVFLFPLLFAFGIVSPLIIKLLCKHPSEAGEKSSKVYTISTFGGILATIFFGFYFIPFVGIKASIVFTTTIMLLSAILMFYIIKTKASN